LDNPLGPIYPSVQHRIGVAFYHGQVHANETYNDLTRRFYGAYRNDQLCVLEGFHPARHAIAFGTTLESAVTYDPDRLFQLIEKMAPDAHEQIESVLTVLSREQFSNLSQRSLSSPLLSIAKRPHYAIDELWRPNGKPIVFLDRPRNPGNVGAAIRVGAGAGIASLIVTGNVDPFSPVTIRAAAGLQYALGVANAPLPETLTRPIVLIDMDGATVGTVAIDPNAVLVVGAERYGISPQIRQRASMTVGVPMKEGVSSLNLSTALSAVLFSWKSACVARGESSPW